MGLMKKILDSRRRAPKSKYSPGESGLPFSFSIESLSEADRFARKQDTQALAQFNADVKRWSNASVIALRRSVKTLVKRDILLSDSIRGNIYYDNKYGREVNRIGFSFAREGIFIHKGARRGRGGVVGSSWIDRHGVRKSRALSSAGKQSGGIQWFDPVIDRRLPQLADIIADYSGTLQLNAANLFIEK